MLGIATLAMTLGAAGGAPQDALPGPDAPEWAPHRALKVLYAGYPGGSREEAFGAFLEEWFDESAVIPLKELDTDSANGFDLVIVDWTSQYGKDGYEKPQGLTSAPGELDEDFTKPVIAMDYIGTQLRPRYKLDWL
jgi:hypothetical protein